MTTFKGKVLAITGGTGSFGKEMLKYFLKTDVEEVRVLSRDEKKQDDLKREISDPRLNLMICDTREQSTVRSSLRNVDFVFHAAALKQVPTCETYPQEALKTNVLGSINVIEAAIDSQVSRVVMLSTDKAVYPVNSMGLSKALMEKIAVSYVKDIRATRQDTRIMITRYGNVMCSRGSVIPLFISQILNGQQLTITVPQMTRFLMSLNQSVDLVLEAFINGLNGDRYIRRAPATTVCALAEALLKIFNSNADIKLVGMRPGEKIHETLCTREEMSNAYFEGDFIRIPQAPSPRPHGQPVPEQEKNCEITDDYSSNSYPPLSVEELIPLLLEQDYVKEVMRTGNPNV